MNQETQAKYELIFEELKSGSTAAESCRQLSVSPAKFSEWKRANHPEHDGRSANNKRRSKSFTKVQTVPIPEAEPTPKKTAEQLSVIVIKGDASTVAETLKNMF